MIKIQNKLKGAVQYLLIAGRYWFMGEMSYGTNVQRKKELIESKISFIMVGFTLPADGVFIMGGFRLKMGMLCNS